MSSHFLQIETKKQVQNMNSYHYESTEERGRLILVDTDIGGDCDDAGAMAVLFRLAREKHFSFAVACCTPELAGAEVVGAIAGSRGITLPSVGLAERSPVLADDTYHVYDRPVAAEFRGRYPAVPTGEALAFYLRVLRAAPDGGVVWVPIGPVHQLAEVWRVDPELVARKVSAVVCMGGIYGDFAVNGHREYNFRVAAEATRTVFGEFPCPIICVGLELGRRIPSGFAEKNPADPVNRCYEIHTKGKMLRPSWDPLTVLFAVEGEGTNFRISEPGINRIERDGSNFFTPDPAGHHYYLTERRAPAEVAAYLEQLYRIPADLREERKESQ